MPTRRLPEVPWPKEACGSVAPPVWRRSLLSPELGVPGKNWHPWEGLANGRRFWRMEAVEPPCRSSALWASVLPGSSCFPEGPALPELPA